MSYAGYGQMLRNTWHYLYDRPKDRTQYYVQSFASGASRIMAGLYSARDNTSYMDDYLKNRGIDYGDVRYPSQSPGWSGGAGLGSAVSSGYRMLSRNVSNLYRDDERFKSRMREAFNDGRSWEQAYRWHRYKPY